MTRLPLLAAFALVGCAQDYTLEHTPPQHASAPVEQEANPDPIPEYSMRDLDVVVVMDGSGSMQDDRERVARGVTLLSDDIRERAQNWSITFVTSDPGELGLVGPFGPDDSPATLATAPFMLPVTGVELPFGALYSTFLSNGDLFPRSRDLLVFMVTDEDDHTFGVTVPQFDEWLDSLKDDDAIVDVVAIADVSGTCGSEDPARLAGLAELRGTQLVDLCGENWEDWLDQTSILTDQPSPPEGNP